MSGRRRGLSDEDRELWRGVTRSVSPLRKTRRKPESEVVEDVPTAKPARKTKAAAVIAPVTAPKQKSAAPPPLTSLDRRTKQRIARGSHPIDARIDLHGYTLDQAYTALSRFLLRAHADGGKIALVITGKGTFGTGERGALKRQVPMWLNLPEFRAIVVGFESAAIGHGGEGALYVRLRRKRT
jgi:DNA-nicking Smr family endonuclease